MNQRVKKGIEYSLEGLWRTMRLGTIAIVAKLAVNTVIYGHGDIHRGTVNHRIDNIIEEIRNRNQYMDTPVGHYERDRPVVYLDVKRVGTPNPYCGTATTILYDQSSVIGREYAKMMGVGPCMSTRAMDSAHFIKTERSRRLVSQTLNGLRNSQIPEDSIPTITWKDVYTVIKSPLSR